MNTDAIAAAITDAMPILAATVYPVLAVTAGVGIWWLTLPDTDDGFSIDDYKPATGDVAPRRLRPAEAHTQPVQLAAWATEPVYTVAADRLLTAVTTDRHPRTQVPA